MRLGSERRVLPGRPSRRAAGVPHRGRGGAPARQEFIRRGNRAFERFSVGEGHAQICCVITGAAVGKPWRGWRP